MFLSIKFSKFEIVDASLLSPQEGWISLKCICVSLRMNPSNMCSKPQDLQIQ